LQDYPVPETDKAVRGAGDEDSCFFLLFSGFPFTVFAMGWELIFGLLTLHVCELLVGKIYIYIYMYIW